MKTLSEFNREFEYREIKKMLNPENKKDSPVKTAIFYGALVAMVLIAFVYSNSGEAGSLGKKYGPFAINSVLTDSMASVYPAGTLVASWSITPNETLKAGLLDGDDIVFVTESGMVMVHRIIKIVDNYEGSGQRGFSTQGVEVANPDSFITFEGNVIGKVVFAIPFLGRILGFIADNIIFVVLGVAVVFIITALLRKAFSPDKNASSDKKDSNLKPVT